MCHFIWRENPCSECGELFDRKLTCCQSERTINKPRARRSPYQGPSDAKGAPCDKQYAMLVDPTFKCQECKLIEMEPWLPVQQLRDLQRQRTEDGGESHRVEEAEWEDKKDVDWEPDSDDED